MVAVERGQHDRVIRHRHWSRSMATLVPPELLVALGAALTVIGLLAAAVQRPTEARR
jgi:hypothetical protein